jgi:hypothetical protein
MNDTRRCDGCMYWKKDWGMWCLNGWTGEGRDDGHCHLEPRKVYKRADDMCSHHAGLTTPESAQRSET